MPPIIQAENLRKQYGDFTAVDGISFSVNAGECFGFLGPNGAGKTSTVRMIHCGSPVSGGTLRVFGLDVRENERAIKSRLGVCHQEDNLDPDFNVMKNLLLWARYYGIDTRVAKQKAEELLSFFALSEKADSGIRDLSGGMKRRLMLARSLMNNPDLLMLDEPTTGLDPQSRHQVWERIRVLRKQGKTILLTTHYMDEAQSLCDRLMIIDHGKILVTGAPHDLIRQHVGKEVVEVWSPPPSLVERAKTRSWKFESSTDRLLIYTDVGEQVYHEIASSFEVERSMVRTAGLEDLFLKLTGRDLRE